MSLGGFVFGLSQVLHEADIFSQSAKHIKLFLFTVYMLSDQNILLRFHSEVSVWSGRGHGSFIHHVPCPLLPFNLNFVFLISLKYYIVFNLCDIQQISQQDHVLLLEHQKHTHLPSSSSSSSSSPSLSLSLSFPFFVGEGGSPLPPLLNETLSS